MPRNKTQTRPRTHLTEDVPWSLLTDADGDTIFELPTAHCKDPHIIAVDEHGVWINCKNEGGLGILHEELPNFVRLLTTILNERKCSF